MKILHDVIESTINSLNKDGKLEEISGDLIKIIKAVNSVPDDESGVYIFISFYYGLYQGVFTIEELLYYINSNNKKISLETIIEFLSITEENETESLSNQLILKIMFSLVNIGGDINKSEMFLSYINKEYNNPKSKLFNNNVFYDSFLNDFAYSVSPVLSYNENEGFKSIVEAERVYINEKLPRIANTIRSYTKSVNTEVEIQNSIYKEIETTIAGHISSISVPNNFIENYLNPKVQPVFLKKETKESYFNNNEMDALMNFFMKRIFDESTMNKGIFYLSFFNHLKSFATGFINWIRLGAPDAFWGNMDIERETEDGEVITVHELVSADVCDIEGLLEKISIENKYLPSVEMLVYIRYLFSKLNLATLTKTSLEECIFLSHFSRFFIKDLNEDETEKTLSNEINSYIDTFNEELTNLFDAFYVIKYNILLFLDELSKDKRFKPNWKETTC